jgi:hypothetical protein
MNARNSTALAIAASLLTFAPLSSKAADGPLAQFAGTWSGNGKITVQNGTSERIRCRDTNTASGTSLTLTMRCASDSYKFDLSSEISADGGGSISGSWNETTRGVYGSLSGKIAGSNITATATAVGVTAALSIKTAGGSLSVSIRSPGSEVSEVTVTMARAGR